MSDIERGTIIAARVNLSHHAITLDEYRHLQLDRPLTWGPMGQRTTPKADRDGE